MKFLYKAVVLYRHLLLATQIQTKQLNCLRGLINVSILCKGEIKRTPDYPATGEFEEHIPSPRTKLIHLHLN